MNTLDDDLMLWMDADPLATVAEIEWFRAMARQAGEDKDASEVEETKELKPCERCQKDREAV